MGIYLNPGLGGFRESLNSAIYVDKSGLISKTNALIGTRQKYACVSRPRRFGKTMALDMLAAYYGKGADAHQLFDSLAIRQDAGYEEHINRYDVIRINMTDFLTGESDIGNMLATLERRVIRELVKAYPGQTDDTSLMFALSDIYAGTGNRFVILIDEWDSIFREYREDKASQEAYLNFLRRLLKDKEYVALAYMTGILPVKKYGTHSALNMFTEYSMTDPGELAEYFGFTGEEVRELCENHQMDYEEAKAWYDGYELTAASQAGRVVYSLYNPKSLVESMRKKAYGTYWNRTETYEALKIYIQLNLDGLKDAIISMLAGESVCVNTGTFRNDMDAFSRKDDVLTLLIHLGYLSYHAASQRVSIPNKEVSMEFVNTISTMSWNEVSHAIDESRRLLEDLWNGNSAAVAEGIDRAHNEISILKYNDENSLACTIQLAFYFAREYYSIVREMPAGKGFADVCFIPRPFHADKPKVIIERKCDRSAESAIAQIKKKRYPDALRDRRGETILVGIDYDRDTKRHTCVIERYTE